MGTRKRPRVCCLAIDLWRVLKIYSEKHVFDGTPLYSSAYSVVKVLFPRFGGAQRSLEEKGKKEAKKCVRIQSINNCPKKYIYSPHFLHQNIFRFDRISRIRITQSYCIMWSSLSSSQKVRIFRFFRWRRASGGNWIFNCDPIQLFKLPVHAIFPRVQNTRRVFTHALFSASSSSSSFKRNESTGHPRHQPDGSVLRRLHLR